MFIPGHNHKYEEIKLDCEIHIQWIIPPSDKDSRGKIYALPEVVFS